ncbi:hypothetical protein [Streptomyces sp. NPDC006333]|uniref:hypothetical protein n=1 Tax=Streptomyces sp. NPDC006333 TaxID=3156753 RepID=UPI0033ADED59
MSKNVFAWKILTMEDQDQLELAERDLTHPELVAKFKDFVSEFVRYSPREIIVALDELDKMDRAEDALAFVNGVKDLLHIQGVHFLVSVSEDALHSFSLRGVPVRDAFDSTFDAIIPVERFTIDESRNLLKCRVVAFPDSLSLFCHALSGGVPRDLIRAARESVSMRRDGDAPVPVDMIVWTVIRRRTISICEALVAKMRQGELEFSRLWLHSLTAISTAQDSTALVASLEHTSQQVREALPVSGDDLLASNVAAYFMCVSTLCAYFSKPRTNGEWEQEEETGSA